MNSLGPVAVITGTTHGIGLVTARELARAGCHVVMLCRDVAAARRVRADILTAFPAASLSVEPCDLASLQSVRECAGRVRDAHASFHLLINNAGIASWRHRMSIDGFELTFATNHLGPFLLTHLLRDRLAAGSGRIVTVASRIHDKGRLRLEQVRDARAPYRGTQAYAQSKLANVLHTFALARRLQGTGVTANCLHPGVVATNLLPRWVSVAKRLLTPVLDVERGARTTLHLALSPEVAEFTGRYFDEHQREVPAAALACDVELQERLWQRSAEWVGVEA